MNILIISEVFLKGGLETYIYTMYEELKKENKVYFCFGKFDSGLDLNKKDIFTNFNFSSQSNISDFCSDVKNLVEIINTKKIDLIVVNPFYSFFPAVFAAQITNTKIVYIYHGMASINFPNNIVSKILFHYAFQDTIEKVFSVTEKGVEAFKYLNYNKSIFLPNPINDKLFKSTKIKSNKTWVLISRLDADKVQDIYKLLELLPSLEIDQIDIIGDGTEKDKINKYINKNNLNTKIILKGYSSEIHKDIVNKYTGIIGLGRVAIEGLVMNYPVLLIGYGKIVGVINKRIFNDVYQYNFVPNFCNSLSIEMIQEQIKEINAGNFNNYQFRKKVIEKFGIENFIETFYEEVNKINFNNKQNMIDLYNNIVDLSFKNKNDNFYTSNEVYILLKKHISTHTIDLNLKNDFIHYDNYLQNQLLLKQNIEMSEKILELEMKQIEIYNSNSWKITAPLRKFKNMTQKNDKDSENER